MKNKVWIFVTNQVFSGLAGSSATRVSVFDSEKKAKDAFNSWKAQEINLADENGWIVEEDEYNLSCYEEGYYDTNHSDGWIEDKEIM